MPCNPFLVEIRIGFLICIKHRVIFRVLFAVTRLKFGHVGFHILRHGEGFFLPAVERAHGFDRVLTQRFAVCPCGVRLWRAVRNLRADDNQRRMRFVRLGLIDCLCDRVRVLAVCNMLHRPAVCFKALADVLRKRKTGAAFYRNFVSVVEQN